jgi:hypothetical protein
MIVAGGEILLVGAGGDASGTRPCPPWLLSEIWSKLHLVCVSIGGSFGGYVHEICALVDSFVSLLAAGFVGADSLSDCLDFDDSVSVDWDNRGWGVGVS